MVLAQYFHIILLIIAALLFKDAIGMEKSEGDNERRNSIFP